MSDRSSTTELLAALPDHLAERTRPIGAAGHARGAFVVYWMRTACRDHDNPALDVALTVAARLDLPVFVYHALSERYPYASDRHHTFILEGARDVQRALAGRDIGHAFHLERPGARGPHLLTLSRRAALVVTEDMPVAPLRGWTERLAAAGPTPVWCVDTACILPMRLTRRPFERAFAFRRATEAARAERLQRPWPDAEPVGQAFLPDDLPFVPLDLDGVDIASLVAECDIDHGVGPAAHTPGGSVAGYRRWEAFRARHLAAYARARNDPLRPGAVSRMSAYLHHGQVSPFRLARAAAALGGDGAAKFLDELLVWRELAHGWCWHRPDHASVGALPDWARQTLEAHRADRRPDLPSFETLARARTGDALWDAAQRSLLVQGELHNNVRMTWGKALAQWTEGPAPWLEMAIDLNHRYALDGRDPNSYAGILWCLGQFDRPFTPERPVTGTVRPRSTRDHARRLDVARYAAATGRSAMGQAPRVAVIGAGIAGLSCARTLADHGLEVVVFDKGRSVGGRMATRRVGDRFQFDHGAQYFAARAPAFARHVASWCHDGLVAPWPVAFCDDRGDRADLSGGAHRDAGHGRDSDARNRRFVGVPAMSAVARHLAADLTVHQGVRVARLGAAVAGWRVLDEQSQDLGRFDRVVVAVPAPQAVTLLEAAPALATRASAAVMQPCWAVMVGLESPFEPGFTVARWSTGPLAWAARNRAKPGRGGGEAWMLHAGPAWSSRHLEDAPDEVARRLVAAFTDRAGELPGVAHVSAHRWRFALASTPLGETCLFDRERGIGACGDWCLGGRVEAAFESGRALAGRLLACGAAPAAQLDLFGGEGPSIAAVA